MPHKAPAPMNISDPNTSSVFRSRTSSLSCGSTPICAAMGRICWISFLIKLLSLITAKCLRMKRDQTNEKSASVMHKDPGDAGPLRPHMELNSVFEGFERARFDDFPLGSGFEGRLLFRERINTFTLRHGRFRDRCQFH